MNYSYDGDGRRVYKSNGKLYWYGAGGDILAETDANGTTTAEYIFFGGKRIAMLPAGGSPLYYVEDMLGSSRVITQSNGVVCYDADFYPYGGERAVTNTCPHNYKFESKERDTETGNDDFGARYYTSRFGRWLSADWSAVPVPVPYANLTNPQTLNLYAMAADDPESFADLDGHFGDTFTSSPDTISCRAHTEACESYEEQQNRVEQENHSQQNAPQPQQPQTRPTQQLTDVQDTVRNNPAYKPEPNGRTWCNFASCDIVAVMGGPMGPFTGPRGKPAIANQIADNLAKSKEYREVTSQEVQKLANEGKLVVLDWRNPDPHHHGHVATVRPDNQSGPPAKGSGPLINNVGAKNGVMRASEVFRKGSEKYCTPMENH